MFYQYNWTLYFKTVRNFDNWEKKRNMKNEPLFTTMRTNFSFSLLLETVRTVTKSSKYCTLGCYRGKFMLPHTKNNPHTQSHSSTDTNTQTHSQTETQSHTKSATLSHKYKLHTRDHTDTHTHTHTTDESRREKWTFDFSFWTSW